MRSFVLLHRSVLLTFACCCSASLLACATAGSPGSEAAGAASSVSTSNAPRITRDEIDAANLPTAYDLVDRLRRSWFRRDARTNEPVSVIVDNARAGGVEALRTISSTEIGELLYVTSDQAVTRWPNQNVTGSAIVVVRRR